VRKGKADHTLACVGAVIGAGFASGREVMVFFSQYGALSWALVLLATATMTVICVLSMRKMRHCDASSSCALYEGQSKVLRWMGEGSLMLLMAVTGGAMISASGELVAKLLPVHGAYWIGLVITVLLAWLLAQQSIRPLAAITAALTAAIILSYVLMMGMDHSQGAWVRVERTMDAAGIMKAGISAISYGCMNMAIALGVICQGTPDTNRKICRTSVLFGSILSCLFLLCNYVLLRHEELSQAAFPIVLLLNGLGRGGFLFSAILLYLAVLTTTIAIFFTIRKMTAAYTQNKWIINGLTMGVPVLFSFIGFGQIVEGLYAPMGFACLALVFVPALFYNKKPTVGGSCQRWVFFRS